MLMMDVTATVESMILIATRLINIFMVVQILPTTAALLTPLSVFQSCGLAVIATTIEMTDAIATVEFLIQIAPEPTNICTDAPVLLLITVLEPNVYQTVGFAASTTMELSMDVTATVEQLILTAVILVNMSMDVLLDILAPTVTVSRRLEEEDHLLFVQT